MICKPEDLVGKCECADPGCRCRGKCDESPYCIGYRVDMDDATGTKFCHTCGQDAVDSGLYVFAFPFPTTEPEAEDSVPCECCGKMDFASTVNSPTCEDCWLASK